MDSTTTTQAAPEPRSVDAGRGVNWWTDSWTLFMKNPGMCIVLALVLLVVCAVLNFVPLLGGLALALLMPAFMGSWLLAARKLESGGTLEVGDAFLAFKDQLTPLLVLGALSLAATAVIFIVLTVFGMGAAFGMGFGGGMHGGMGAMAAMGAGLFGVLVAMALFVPVSMAFWFAPALVVFDGVAPVEAIKASFAACLRNVMPFLVYGVLGTVACLVPFLIYGALGLVAAIVALVPVGLCWLVLLPLSGLSIYLSYRDIFNR